MSVTKGPKEKCVVSILFGFNIAPRLETRPEKANSVSELDHLGSLVHEMCREMLSDAE
jgi:hypothetical protein